MSDAAQRPEQIRARVTEIAAELSGFDEDDLAPNRTFLELGFDSLFLTQLATAFSKEYDARITFRQLISEFSTIDNLTAHLDATLPAIVSAPPQPAAQEPAEPQKIETPVAAAPPARPIAPVASGARDNLSAVFAEQVALMQQQLELLRSMKAGAQKPAAMEPAPVAAVAAPPAAAPTAEDAVEKPQLPKGFGPSLPKDGEDAPSLTPSQRAHIDRLAARYSAKTAGSKARTQEGRTHHADPRTAAGFNPLWKELVYPIHVRKSLGAYLWDVDDNQYIDLLNGFGPNFFGHGAPFINEALKAQLEAGYEIGPQTPNAADAAKLLCELTGMDRVSWVNTGSEAVQAAIRISRTVTGRDKIVVFKGDYHGNFDEVLVRGVTTKTGDRRTLPLAPGIPYNSVENVIVLDYGEESALAAIREKAGDIAAVLVEPIQSRRPEFQPRDFLHKLRALTEVEDIVLVFDEVITGFRTCPGGAQEYFGVRADIATYGKIIGGGMPIGVVAGRAKFMDTFDGGAWTYGDASAPTAGVTFFAGTFVRHPMAIAAAHASLQYLKNAGPALQQGVNRKAERLARELNAFFEARGVNFFVAQFASQMYIRNNEENELATLFFYHMRDRGIHVLEGFPCYMTAAHTDEDVDRIIEAAKDSILEMQADAVLAAPVGAPADYKRRFALTASQREVWIASQMGELASCAFNESDSVIIDGLVDAEEFTQAVLETFNANEAFRLRFDPDGQWQEVSENAGAIVDYADLSELSPTVRDDRLADIIRTSALTPFDLENGPIVRAHLVRMAHDRHIFTLFCHHLGFDGYSADLTMREITGRYAAKLTRDESYSQTTAPFSVYAAKAGSDAGVPDYWREVFADGAPSPLDLPLDNPRGARREHRGATVHAVLPGALAARVGDAARRIGVSQSTLYMSAYAALLSRLSSQVDVIVGMPAAGQARYEIDAVGYCVNILPVRTRPRFDAPFDAFARENMAAAAAAFEHQDVSVSGLVSALGMPRDPSRLPLIEAVFNFTRYFVDLSIPGCRVMTRENRRHAVYHDMFLNLAESNGEILIDWEYALDLFDSPTIERWIEFYKTLLEDICDDPAKPLGDLRLERGGDDNVVVALPSR